MAVSLLTSGILPAQVSFIQKVPRRSLRLFCGFTMDLAQRANINLLMKAWFVDPSQALNSFSVNGPTVSTLHPNLHMSHQVRSATTILSFFPLSFSIGFDVHRFTHSEFINRGQTVKSEFHCKSWDIREKICWTSWTVVKRACGCCPAKSSQLQASDGVAQYTQDFLSQFFILLYE